MLSWKKQNMNERTSFIYLHGFASSPSSSKAMYFADRLSGKNAQVSIPDLNGSDFKKLTLSSQLQIIDNQFNLSNTETDARARKKIALIGSSMGGLLAVLKSMASSQVAALILMYRIAS